MVTIKDLAARLNVSASTVGRALADDPRISASMKQKVNALAGEFGYVANRAARMMRGVSSNLVGLIIPDVRNHFYSTIAHALSKCIEREGLQLTLSETEDDRTIEHRHVRELVSANVAGMIIVPTAKPLPETVKLLKAIPHIQLLREHTLLGDRVFGMDDARATDLACRHLYQLGHRRIGYVGPSSELSTGVARLSGFREVLQVAKSWDVSLEICRSLEAADEASAILRDLLASPRPPTALVMGGVQHTHAMVDACIDLGVTVPRDVSIVGFGDEAGFRWWGAGLTTISLPVSDMATSCGLWFLHQLRQKGVEMPSFRSISSPVLVVRGSTAELRKPGAARSKSATP